MKIYLSNQSLELKDSDFLQSGGEGQVFVKNNIAYKIYHNISKMIPKKKILDLSPLSSNDKILAPKEIVYDKDKKEIGYCMNYLKNSYNLCQIFNKSFRDRNNIKNDKILDLIKNFKNSVDFILEVPLPQG